MAWWPCGLMHNAAHDGGVFFIPTCHHEWRAALCEDSRREPMACVGTALKLRTVLTFLNGW